MAIVGALPVNLTNGTIADATQVMADFNSIKDDVNNNAAENGANSDITSLSGLTTPLSASQGGTGTTTASFAPPLGRLTLASNAPVLPGDVTAAATIYYTLYMGDTYPSYNGIEWNIRSINELSLPLDPNAGHTGYQQSGKNYDLFIYNDGGTDRLVTGPAWTSDTGRGAGAGTTQLNYLNGVLSNFVSMTARFGTGAGDTVTVAQGKGTYVGTMRASADGQTQVKFGSSAAGGGEAWLGIWNAYNKVSWVACVQDNTDSWTNATSAWRALNNSNANRVSAITGLAQTSIMPLLQYNAGADIGIAKYSPYISIALDSVTVPHTRVSPGFIYNNSAAAGTYGKAVATAQVLPLLGWHYIQALDWGSVASGGALYGDDGFPGFEDGALIVEGMY